MPPPGRLPEPVAISEPVIPPPVPAAAKPVAAAPGAVDPQQAVVEALSAAKQTSAADAMADAVWTVGNGEASVQTELSKMMLPVVMNAEAEKIARAALRAAGIAKLTLLTGTPAAAATKKSRPARSGSAQAKALEHPMVQQAQKLFNAEIQSVIDLRKDD